MLTVKKTDVYGADGAGHGADTRRLSAAAGVASQYVQQKQDGDKTYLGLNALPTFV